MAPPAPITLALRFSKSAPFSSPFNASTLPESRSPSPPILSSRFSVETLAIKTPRLGSLSTRQWFSTSSPTKTSYPSGFRKSQSESKLEISSPRNASHGPSLDGEEEEVMAVVSCGGGAFVVRNVDEAFEFAKGHGRNESGGSERSFRVCSKQQAPSRPAHGHACLSGSVSSPAPPPRPSRALPPIRYQEVPPLVPGAPLSTEARIASDNDVLPPPRNDSRSATLPLRSNSRNSFVPPTPVANLIAAHAVLSDSSHQSSFIKLGRCTPTRLPSIAPFKAVLVKSASPVHVKNESMRVRLDVGGTLYVTTAETLLDNGRGGKLGQFIDETLNKIKENSTVAASEVRQDGGDSIYPSSEDGDSNAGTDVFDLSPSPFPSPFPFMRYDTGSSDEEIAAGLALDTDGSIIFPTSPSSPIDPFMKRMLPVAPHTLLKTQTIAASHRAELISSPLPHLRLNSFHSSVQGSPRSPRSPLSSSTHDSHYSSGHLSSITDDSHVELVLEAFQSISPSPLTELEPAGLPLDINEKSFVEDGSRSSLLGVPRGTMTRGSLKLKGPRDTSPKPSFDRISPVPSLKIYSESDADGSRPPSLSMSESSDEGEEKVRESKMDRRNTLEIFLDRNGKVYEAVLDFLRDGQLPSSHTIPRCTLPTPLDQPDVDAATLSIFSLHPSSTLHLLASLKTLTTEARWLGMEELVETCEREMERVVEVVRWLDGRRDKVMREQNQKAGWI